MTDATPDSLDVIAAAPHPDDLEILCGGTLAKLVKQGYRVGMVDLTSGEPTPRGSPETRRAEAEAARLALGVQVRIQLDLPNRILMDGPEARYALATVLRRYRPKVLIIPAGRTPAASPDHYQGMLIGEAARFHSQLTKWEERFDQTPPYRVPHLVYAPFPFDAEVRLFHSTFIIDISETLEQKLAAVSCYQSQFDDPRLQRVKQMLTGAALTAGARAGFLYGEQFALPTPIGGTDLVKIVQGGAASPAPVQLPGRDHLPMG